MLKVALTRRAAADLRSLAPEAQNATLLALGAIPPAFGRPHVHRGVGIRQLRPRIFEARVGLSLRALFVLFDETAEIQMIGSHDEVRRYLRRR